MKRFLVWGFLSSLLQGIASKPVESVKDAAYWETRVHGSPKEKSISGNHNPHNMVDAPHNLELKDQKAIVNKYDEPSPHHFSKLKPHKELFFTEDTNLNTDIVLDSVLIQESAELIKSNMINELRMFIPNSKLQDDDKLEEVKEMIERFSKIKEIVNWDDRSSEDSKSPKSWVLKIIDSMHKELKLGYNAGFMTFDLQIMKCLGYLNVHAKDFFLNHIFESLSNEEVGRMWRALIDAEAEFRTVSIWHTPLYQNEAEYGMGENPSLYPGRYNNFLEQLHFEWLETNERGGHLKAFQAAIDKKEVPNVLKTDILELKDEFSCLKFRTSWPVIDKGYYEDTFPVIQKIKEILSLSGTRDIENVSQTVQLVYQVLNHIYRFDLKTTMTSGWLNDILDDSNVQQSLYKYVLSKKGLSHCDVSRMKLLQDFKLEAHLDKKEQESLKKEWESKCYNILSQDIPSKKDVSQMKKTFLGKFKTISDSREKESNEDQSDYNLKEDILIKRPSKDHLKLSEERVSILVDSVLKDLKNLSKKNSMSEILSPDEKVSIEILNRLVTQNHLAWKLTRSKIEPIKSIFNSLNSSDSKVQSDKSLLEYLKSLRIKAGNIKINEERILLENPLDFVLGMSEEIEEYKQRSINIMSLKIILKSKTRRFSNRTGDSTPFFLQQYSDFIENLSQIWFETRWRRKVERIDYDVRIVELAKESFDLIQSQAFAHMPKGLDAEFVGILRYLARKDPSGFFKKFYDHALADLTDFSTYQFFTNAIPPKERYFTRPGDWYWD
ncbi:hypothetical protein DFH28DRAFT_537371 [Melampsora americana]|nr:hypothetical protein DFH28DRAFT_537371 [Melampsora americana]